MGADASAEPADASGDSLIPGEVRGPDDQIEINGGRPVLRLRVEHHGDRPVQVGSHYHFAEANQALHFDRLAPELMARSGLPNRTP